MGLLQFLEAGASWEGDIRAMSYEPRGMSFFGRAFGAIRF